MVAQMKVHVALMEGITPEDQVELLAGLPLEAEATLDHCVVEALTTLKKPTACLEVKSTVPWPALGKEEGRLPRWPSRKERRQAERSGRCRTSGTLSMLCPPLARQKAPMPT
ncbi:unnamed protein product, partial [Gulo gulo]